MFSNAFIGQDRTQILYSSGIASSTRVVNGGSQILKSGAVATDTVLQDATQFISSGATASNTVLLSGATQYISGGSAIDTTVYAGAVQSIGATLYAQPPVSGTILSGGTQYLQYHEGAVDTVIAGGGTQFGYYAGTITDTTIGAGGLLYALDTPVSNCVVQAGGQLNDENSYEAVSDVTVQSGGMFVLQSSSYTPCKFDHVTIQSGGSVVLITGATTTGLTLDPGAIVSSVSVAVFSGSYNIPGRYLLDPYLSGHVLSSYVYQIVASGGVVSGNTVQSSSEQYIYSGGVARDTTLQYGGFQYVDQGYAAQTVIENGGRQIVDYGGTAIGTTIEAGGDLYITSNGFATNVSMHVGAFIEFGGLQFRSGGSVHLGPNDLLVVFEGGRTEQLQLVGDYSSDQFFAYNDGGGTGVVLSAAQPAAAIAAHTAELLPALHFPAPSAPHALAAMAPISAATHAQPLLLVLPHQT